MWVRFPPLLLTKGEEMTKTSLNRIRRLAGLEERKEIEAEKIGFNTNIEDTTTKNNDFRRVLYTAKNSQLVLMSVEPGDDLGEESHNNIDQFFRIESGVGKVIMDGKDIIVTAGDAVIVPAGTKHNVINTSSTENLKFYTIYSPPKHKEGAIQKTKKDAERLEKIAHKNE